MVANSAILQRLPRYSHHFRDPSLRTANSGRENKSKGVIARAEKSPRRTLKRTEDGVDALSRLRGTTNDDDAIEDIHRAPPIVDQVRQVAEHE